MASDTPLTSNSDFAWSQFDSEAYFQHYYGEPHPDDDLVVALTVAAFKAARAKGDAPFDIIDVGTGPNLIPMLAALPVSESLTAWEYAETNVAWLEAEIAKNDMRPQWRHFWDVTRQAYGEGWTLPDNPIPALRDKVSVRQGSIYDLPERRWSAASMFFCAESITSELDEFERGCAAFARCVKPGGLLAAAFLVNSGGYVVSERPFPVLSLTADQIEAIFQRYAVEVTLDRIGIVEHEIRSGYSGFVFLTGRST